MIIDCISDLHGFQPELPGGDLLIIAGDLTARDEPTQHVHFHRWLREQPYDRIVFIAGNHDGFMQKNPHTVDVMYSSEEKITYLQDSGIEYKGLKIWGSPWTPEFLNWHFMKKRGEDIRKMWDLIPEDTNILVTHSPALGIQDQAPIQERFLGCEELIDRINFNLKDLRLHVFGHIHQSYGQVIRSGVTHINASIMNERYQPVNSPIRVTL